MLVRAYTSHKRFKSYTKILFSDVIFATMSDKKLVTLTRAEVGRSLGLHTVVGVMKLHRVMEKNKWTMNDLSRMGVIDFMSTKGVGDAMAYAAMHILDHFEYGVDQWLKHTDAKTIGGAVHAARAKAGRRKARDQGKIVNIRRVG